MSERDQDREHEATGVPPLSGTEYAITTGLWGPASKGRKGRNPFSEYPRIVRVLAWVVLWGTIMAILKALGFY